MTTPRFYDDELLTADNPGQSLLDEPEYREQAAILHRKLEQPDFEVPSYDDGAELTFIADMTVQYHTLRYRCRFMYIQNLTPASFTLTYDNGRTFPIPPGMIGGVPLPETARLKVQSETAESGELSITLFIHRPAQQYFASISSTASVSPVGTGNAVTGQVTGLAGPAVTTLAGYRATRTGITIVNEDTAIGVRMYVGGVAGLLLQAGASVVLTYRGSIQFLANSGTPNVSFWDEYN